MDSGGDRLMTDLLRAGPASCAGLRWLARVGPSPLEAWRCAMGWAYRTAHSHAQRLEREGWLVRYAMMRGSGSLLAATNSGIRAAELELTAGPRPTPTLWAHDCGCAWTAAWLTVREAEWRGPRELLGDPSISGRLEWQTGAGWRRSTHRPDLMLTIDAGQVVVEVELQRKSTKRLAAILGLYGAWIAASRIAGVVYVCATQRLAARVQELSPQAGIPSSALRLELLDKVRAQAIDLRATGARR